MAILCFAFCKVLMQMEPYPSYSNELFRAIDSYIVFKLNVAYTADYLEILKKVESNIYLACWAVGMN
jgi:hypothetical protein